MKNGIGLNAIIFVTFLASAFTLTFAQQLRVESVTVDSVWNSDSSWYDGQGLLQTRHSRDLLLSFIPAGQGMAECSLALSLDSGASWNPQPDPVRILAGDFTQPLPCGQKTSILLRVLGEDRSRVVFKIIARQSKPLITGAPRVWTYGQILPIPPGTPASVDLRCHTLNNFAPLEKIWWDVLADGTWDDSTTTLHWIWNTTIPVGVSGQIQFVVVQARDLNGLWSNPETLTVQFGLARPLTLASIPGGSFQMGQTGVADSIHRVTISAFQMGITEVTQEQYEVLVGHQQLVFELSSTLPVTQFSWHSAALFCNALSKLAGKDTVYQYVGDIRSTNNVVVIDYSKNGYRLPTEAEWEYAYRGGTTTEYFWGNSTVRDTIEKYAWWYSSSGGQVQRVAQKLPNAWGLYDMAGNAQEWVGDWYFSPYKTDSVIDPTGPSSPSGGGRSIRSGNFNSIDLRAAYRFHDDPFRFSGIGFRVACRP